MTDLAVSFLIVALICITIILISLVVKYNRLNKSISKLYDNLTFIYGRVDGLDARIKIDEHEINKITVSPKTEK